MTGTATSIDVETFRRRSPSRFSVTISALYGDLDPNGHINDARYLTYLEECRLAFRREIADIDPPGAGYTWPIGELTIRYLSSAYYPGLVTVELAPISVGRTSYTLGYGVYTEERCCAVALTRTVRIDTTTGRSAAGSHRFMVCASFHALMVLPCPARGA